MTINTPTSLQRLKRLDSCSLSDALDKLGLPGAVCGLAPLTISRRIAGAVVTVKLGVADGAMHNRHLGAGAIVAARPGDVIVIEHAGRRDVSGWGGLLSRGAVRKGVEGVIIDGACRDIDESRDLGLPLYGLAGVPFTARGRIVEHSFNEPISIAGVRVRPGDLVLADASGVVFIEGGMAETVLAEAECIAAKEATMAEQIDRGIPIDQVLDKRYEDMLSGGGR